MIAAISSMISGLIHLLIPTIEAAQPEYLILACLCTITCLFTGSHDTSPVELALEALASERQTALPHHISETTSENAP